MNSYEEVAVSNDREALTINDVKVLAQLTDNELLSNDELVAIQNAIRLYASKTNQVLHITGGGAMYITDNHDLREATEVTRLT